MGSCSDHVPLGLVLKHGGGVENGTANGIAHSAAGAE